MFLSTFGVPLCTLHRLSPKEEDLCSFYVYLQGFEAKGTYAVNFRHKSHKTGQTHTKSMRRLNRLYQCVSFESWRTCCMYIFFNLLGFNLFWYFVYTGLLFFSFPVLLYIRKSCKEMNSWHPYSRHYAESHFLGMLWNAENEKKKTVEEN